MVIVSAETGSTASANPAARLPTTNARRVRCLCKSRLSGRGPFDFFITCLACERGSITMQTVAAVNGAECGLRFRRCGIVLRRDAADQAAQAGAVALRAHSAPAGSRATPDG